MSRRLPGARRTIPIDELSRAFGLDLDPDALQIAGNRLATFGDRVMLVRTRYDGISEAVGETITVDTPATRLREIAAERGVEIDPTWDGEKIALENAREIARAAAPTFVRYVAPTSALPSIEELSALHVELAALARDADARLAALKAYKEERGKA